MRPKIGAVRLRAVLDVQTERLALEDARVFGKEAEQNPHQEPFEFVALVAARFQGVVQIVHDPHGLEVDRVLVLKVVLLIARNEGEIVDMTVQLVQRERDPMAAANGLLHRVFRLQIPQADPRKIGNDHVAGHFLLPAGADEVGDIAVGLRLGLVKILAAALVLHQQHSGPEEVDAVVVSGKILYRFLEMRHRPPGNAEDGEELVPERLFLGPFAAGAGPVAGKARWRCGGFRSRRVAWGLLRNKGLTASFGPQYTD